MPSFFLRPGTTEGGRGAHGTVAPTPCTDGVDRADGRELSFHPGGFLTVRDSLRSPFSSLLPFFLTSLRPLFPHKCSWLSGMGLQGEGNPAPQDVWLGKNAGAADAAAFQLHFSGFTTAWPPLLFISGQKTGKCRM